MDYRASSPCFSKVLRSVTLAASLLAGAACNGGSSQPNDGATPEGATLLVASHAANDFAEIPAFFEDGGDHVVWLTHAGALHRMAKNGTGSVQVALDPRRPRAMLVTATHAYWAVDSSSAKHLPAALLRAPKQGGSVEQLVAGDILDIAIDASGVYWIERDVTDQRLIRALDPDATTPRVVASERRFGAIAVDGASLYFSATDSDGPATTIYRMPKGGGAATGLGSDGDTLSSGDFATLTVVGSDLYWSAQGRVHRVPTQGGAVEPIAGDIRLAPMRADTASVYGFDGKKLVKAPRSGGGTEELLSSDRDIKALAVDPYAAFWIDAKSDCLGWKNDGKTEFCVRYDHAVRVWRLAK
jgi:hypothetical protein